jgi:hypothetical protein
MQHNNITLRHEVISPTTASAIVTYELYERQRPLHTGRVRQYALAMRQGKFRRGTLLSFCCWQGKRYLINGQHTLQALRLANMSMEFGIEEITVGAYDEIAEWYSKYDRLYHRSLSQVYAAHNLAERLQLNKSQVQEIGACCGLLASGFSSSFAKEGALSMYTSDHEVRMKFIEAWMDEARSYFDATAGASAAIANHLRRRGILAVALVTYRFTGSDADEFWHQVAYDDRLAHDDPRKQLHYFIRETKNTSHEPHVVARMVAQAWNAAFAEPRQALRSIQATSLGRPIQIDGTPHDGKRIMRYITPEGAMLHEPMPYDEGQWEQALFGIQLAKERQAPDARHRTAPMRSPAHVTGQPPCGVQRTSQDSPHDLDRGRSTPC